jgi:DNA-binding beta-propeller fold protein YncE
MVKPKNAMKPFKRISQILLLTGTGLLATNALAQPPAVNPPTSVFPPPSGFKTDRTLLVGEGPYKIVTTTSVMGTGGIDYVAADSEGRRLYVPRGQEVLVFDLDTLKPAGVITNTRAHGVAVDPKSHHAFASSKPVAMWDTQTQTLIKTIPVSGGPDGILCDPGSERIFVLSHGAPNITVLDAKDGSLVGTVDLTGAPEQAQSDGQGHLYVDLEDKDAIAVVDLNTLKQTATYSLGGKGGGPAGLGLDVKNHLLFAMCREPAACVILSADDGKILNALPIGNGTDGGGFNPNTMEAFSSQRDGTLTIIKEQSPTSFVVEQNVPTKPGAKTCTLDTRKNQIVLIAVERPVVPAGATNAPAGDRRGGRGFNGPGLLDILVVGP